MSTFRQSVYWSHFSDPNWHELALIDPDVVRVIEAWSELPEYCQKVILALLDVAANDNR
jgi:hypothetical protein